MNFRIVLYLISMMILLEGIVMSATSAVSYLMCDSLKDILLLLGCGVLTITAGILGVFFCRSKENMKTGIREGIAVVSFGWIAISLFGALPFIFVTHLRWYDAIFETLSGFTTTGATVIDNVLPLADGKTLAKGIESVSFGVLFWRSLTQWIGGMGIVVFSLAILPMLKRGASALYNAEVPGVKIRSDQFTPRIAGTAKILCMVYLALTVCAFFMLWLGGMEPFDAVCHSFTTIATGGFSTKNNSIAYYQSSWLQWIIILFMFLGACNFILLYRLMTGLPCMKEEFLTYFFLILFSIIVIGVYLYFSKITDPVSGNVFSRDFPTSFRAAAFQVISLSSTTGFTTADYIFWPKGTQILLLGLIFMGGCGGSTSGGFKCVRVILLAKFALSEMRRSLFPRALQNIRLNGERLNAGVLGRILGFFTLYFLTAFIFLFLLSCVSGMDFETALSASISCLSNVGPGLGKLSPAYTCSVLTPCAKLLMALEMLIGRLELYSVLVLLLPSFWKK